MHVSASALDVLAGGLAGAADGTCLMRPDR